MNITLEVSKYNYENRASASRLGHTYLVKNQQGDNLSVNEITQYNAIEKALQATLQRLTQAYKEADVTITGATIPASLQSLLSDVFTTESQINSVTFA